MLTSETKNKINNARDVLVGKIPDPKGQVDQITNALIYKFMDDQDRLSMSVSGGKASFFIGGLENYAWHKLFDSKLSNQDRANLYSEGLSKLSTATKLPELFRDIFKNAYLPFRAPDTIAMFLDTINAFDYHHPEELGNAFEYLLQIMGSQGDAGQFRTPRHIIEFIVKAVDPKKNETIFDPACGTAGFLIEAFNQIKNGNKLSPQELQILANNIEGVDIDPGMAKIARVNLYLHGFKTPHIIENDTITNENLWLKKKYDVILANPPFMSPTGGIKPHDKFSIKASKSEVLFVDYIAEHLKLHGRAGIIVPDGIIFQLSTAYKQLRKILIDDGYLSSVVSLPSGVFNPYSGVKTSILFLDREHAKKAGEILFIKVDNDGYDLGSQRRVISKNNLPEALDILNKWKKFEKTESLSALYVNKDLVRENGYVLAYDQYSKVIDHRNSTWPEVTLGDLFDMQNGRAFKKDEWATEGVPIIRIANLNTEASSFNYYQGDYDKKVEVSNGDLLFSWSGTVGTSFGPHLWNRGKGLLNQHIYKLSPKELEINTRFAFYILKYLTPEIESKAHGAGGLVHITKSELIKFKIPLPPISFQQQIVKELDAYQNIIYGAKQIINSWKPIIEINSAWEIKCVDELATLEYGIGESAKDVGEYRYVRITDIGEDGKLKNSEKKYISATEESKKYSLKKGDILVARTGATFGKTLYFDEAEESAFAGFLIRLNFNKKLINSKYFWCFAQSDEYWSQANSLMTGGAQPQFNANAVKKILVPLPPLEIQEQITERIEEENALVESSKKLIEIYEQKTNSVIVKLWEK